MTTVNDNYFWAVHSGLPREGPGNNESTRLCMRLLHHAIELSLNACVFCIMQSNRQLAMLFVSRP